MVTTETKTNMYEGMILVPQTMAANLQAAVDHIKDLLDRADAEVVSMKKWDERRLAYEIKGNKRGIYFLAYFNADPSKMQGLERDCNLSETILRAMFTRADHVRPEVIEAADGRQELADEIALRGSDESGQEEGSGS